VATARVDAPVDLSITRAKVSRASANIAEEWGVTKQWQDLLSAIGQVDT
jgi:hypothetical protein